MTRRQALATVPLALTSACATRRPTTATPASPIRRLILPRVNCAANRVIRTVTGLRPYRPSGYVVRTEVRDSKTIIHHYGHGGAGITMSWGTAQLALEQAQASGHRTFAILGCGVIGLTTARLFQRHGLRVTIYTKQTPPDTTSNIAGGLWSPVTLFESGRQSADFSATYVRAAQFAWRYYQSMVGAGYGVRWLPMYSLGTGQPTGPSAPNPFAEVQRLYPEAQSIDPKVNPFPVEWARRRYSMLIEPSIYLNTLLRDYHIAGGQLVVREFKSISEVLSLQEPAIVNCTGLGAKALFNDNELTPIKGQLTFLLPQPEIDYMTLGPGDLYMFPRQDGILLGGTHDEGVWDLTPDPAQTERILSGHTELFSGMRS